MTFPRAFLPILLILSTACAHQADPTPRAYTPYTGKSEVIFPEGISPARRKKADDALAFLEEYRTTDKFKKLVASVRFDWDGQPSAKRSVESVLECTSKHPILIPWRIRSCPPARWLFKREVGANVQTDEGYGFYIRTYACDVDAFTVGELAAHFLHEHLHTCGYVDGEGDVGGVVTYEVHKIVECLAARGEECGPHPESAKVKVAVGGAAKQEAPEPQPTALLRSPEEPFIAAATAAAPVPLSLLQSALPASTPIDAEVLNRILKQRLGEVTAAALKDVLDRAANSDGLQAPIKDLLTTFGGLIATTSDLETRSQTLLASLLRVSLSGAASRLVERNVLPASGCPTDLLETAAYEGLAASAILRPLGFTQSTGKVPEKCLAFARDLSILSDALVTVGTSFELLLEAKESFSGIELSCRPVLTHGQLPLQRVLSGFVAGTHGLASLVKAADTLEAQRVSLDSGQRACADALQSWFSTSGAGLKALGGSGLDLRLGQTAQLLAELRARSLSALIRHPSFWSLIGTTEALGAKGNEVRLLALIAGARTTAEGIRETLTVAKGLSSCQIPAATLNPKSLSDWSGLLVSVNTKCPGGDCSGECSGATRQFLEVYARSIRPLLAEVDAAALNTTTERLVELAAGVDAVSQLVDGAGDFVNEWKAAALAAVPLRGCMMEMEAGPMQSLKTFAASCKPGTSCRCSGLAAEFEQRAGTLIERLKKFGDSPWTEKAAQALATDIDLVRIPFAEVQSLEPLLRAAARNEPLRRGDVIGVVETVHGLGSRQWPDGEVRALLDAARDSLIQAIREDSSSGVGIRIDAATVVSGVTSRYVDRRRAGTYLRASIGTGYLFQSGPEAGKLSAVLQEELGVGYRFQPKWAPSILWGPHVMASGLLYEVVPSGAAGGVLFLAGGLSVNVYRLIDISLNTGPVWHDRDLRSGPRLGVSLSLQLPLGDYLNALTEKSEVEVVAPR